MFAARSSVYTTARIADRSGVTEAILHLLSRRHALLSKSLFICIALTPALLSHARCGSSEFGVVHIPILNRKVNFLVFFTI